MSQKLNKSPTEINLTLPLSKGVSKFPEYSDYSSSHSLSKESPCERDPQNTPKNFIKGALTDKLPSKRLANLLDTNLDSNKRERTNPDSDKSPRESLGNKSKKVIKNNYTKRPPASNTSEVDFLKSKDLAKMALSKLIARDLAKKHLNKTMSTTFIKGDKSSTPSADSRSKTKLKTTTAGYNDSLLDQFRISRSPKLGLSSNSPNKSSASNIISNSVLHSTNTPTQPNIVPVHTPKSSMGGSKESSKASSKSKSRHKKIHSIGNNAPLGREIIMYATAGNLHSHLSPSHKRGISSGGYNSLTNSSVHLSYSSKKLPKTNISLEKTMNHEYLSLTSKDNIESRINDLLLKKDTTIDQLRGIKNVFENILDNYQTDVESSKKNFKLLKKIKQAYEQYIDNCNSKDSKILNLTNEKEDLRAEYRRVCEEKRQIQKENEKLRAENNLLKKPNLVSVNRLKQSPAHSSSNLSTEKKIHQDTIDSPPITKHYHVSENSAHEISSLKQLVNKQQATITALRTKESKMIRLLLAVKKQGVDLEKLYNEEVKGVFDQSTEESTIPTFEKNKMRKKDSQDDRQYMESAPRDETPSIHSQISVPDDLHEPKSVKLSIDVTDDNDMAAFSMVSSKPQNSNLNPNLKVKLKLDLSALKPGDKSSEKSKPSLNLKLPANANDTGDSEPLGFHDEFMAKMDEFSLSWRQAAMAERKY